MAIEWKVWVEVERIDEDNDSYESLEPEPLGSFDTYQQASAFLRSLPGYTYDTGSSYDRKYDRDDPLAES